MGPPSEPGGKEWFLGGTACKEAKPMGNEKPRLRGRCMCGGSWCDSVYTLLTTGGKGKGFLPRTQGERGQTKTDQKS